MRKLLLIFLLLTGSVRANTVFYLSDTTSIGINAVYNGAWDDNTQAAIGYLRMVTTKVSSAMADYSINADNTAARHTIAVRAYLSPPLEWQLIAGKISGQIRANESNSGFNGTVAIRLSIVTNDGLTEKGVLLALNASDASTTPPEFVVTTNTNRRFENSTEDSLLTLTSGIAQQGDRVKLEIGISEATSTTTRTGTLVFGDDAGSDLASDQTTTTANNPHLDFTQTLTFMTVDAVLRDTLRPTANGTYNNFNDSSVANCGATSTNWDMVNDTTTVGASGNDLLEVDATVTQCNQGTTVKESENVTNFTKVFTSIDTVRARARIRTTAMTGTDSARVGIVVGSDTTWGGRSRVDSSWGTWITHLSTTSPHGDSWTNWELDSAEIAVECKTVTATAQQEYTEGLLVVAYTGTANDAGQQLPTPCRANTGDTLYPNGAGQSTGLTKGGDGTGGCTFNWECMSAAPGSGGCDTDNDTVYKATTGAVAWDWYALGTHETNGNSEWGPKVALGGGYSRTNDQVDALGATVCMHLAQTATAVCSVQVALYDGVDDTVFSPIMTAVNPTTNTTFSWYWPNDINGASGAGGNKWFSNSRWDSTHIKDIQLGVGLTINNATSRQVVAKNAYVIVYASSRDTTIPDSTASTLQVTADTNSASTINSIHPMGAVQSSKSNKEKFWGSTVTNEATNKYILFASNDTGKTWTYLNPDTLQIRRSNDGLNTDNTGPLIVADTSNGRQDSLLVAIQRSGFTNQASDTIVTYRSHDPSVTDADFAVPPTSGTHKDSLMLFQPRRFYAAVHSSFYQLGDTIWALGIDTSDGRPAGNLKWFRSKNNGVTWPDSGWVPTIQIASQPDHNSSLDSIQSTSGGSPISRAVFIRWKKGYPAIVSYGWRRSSGTTLVSTVIEMVRWHENWDSTSYAAKGDSIARYAFWRSAKSASPDTVTVANQSGISLNGELAATTVYVGSSATGSVAHIVWPAAPAVWHQMIDSTMTNVLGKATPGRVAEMSDNANNAFIKVGITSRDTMVYIFFTMFKNELTAGTDTNTTFWTCHCGGGKYRGPRPLFWTKSNELQYKWLEIPQYEYNAHRIIALTARSSVRNSAARQAIVSSAIIRAGNWTASVGNIPSRRRRLILYRGKYSERENDEEDSTLVIAPNWSVAHTEDK